MELVRVVDSPTERSPLALARLQRQLTREEAAKRAGITAEEVEWLEEGRVYRFPTTDDALLATLLLGTALGIDTRKARELAGLPAPKTPRANPFTRMVGAAAIAALLSAILVTVLMPGLRDAGTTTTVVAGGPSLPPPWKIKVTVLNGNGDINWTRSYASQVGALGYQIAKVRRADRFDYARTAVYYGAGGMKNGVRLAHQLGVGTRVLPGGLAKNELIVIVGPRRGPG